jgi:hypothetical protein
MPIARFTEMAEREIGRERIDGAPMASESRLLR